MQRLCGSQLTSTGPSRALRLQLTSTDLSDDAATRDKETALLKLGELYRDQKCAITDP